MKLAFDIYLKDENMKSIINEIGTVQRYKREFTIDEAMEIIDNAFKIERLQYGYKVFFEEDEETREIFFRFGNATTRNNETVECFIRKNWGAR